MTKKIWAKALEQWKQFVQKTKKQLDKLNDHGLNRGQAQYGS